jgi:hypothetical protein
MLSVILSFVNSLINYASLFCIVAVVPAGEETELLVALQNEGNLRCFFQLHSRTGTSMYKLGLLVGLGTSIYLKL